MERAKQFPCGEVLTSVPMAKLLGVNWTTLRDWCRDFVGFAESGVFEAGDKGVNYTFEPRSTILWLTRHFEAKREAASAKARRLGEITGTTAMVADHEEMSLAEMDKAISIRVKLRGEKIAEGELTDAERARMAFGSYHSTIQRAVVTFAQEQDPEGRWLPEFRETFEDLAEKLLLALEGAGRKCLAEIGAR